MFRFKEGEENIKKYGEENIKQFVSPSGKWATGHTSSRLACLLAMACATFVCSLLFSNVSVSNKGWLKLFEPL